MHSSTARPIVMLQDQTNFLWAALAGFVTAVVRALSGVDLGEAIYDGATIGASSLSVLTGLTVVSKAVGQVQIKRAAVQRGDLWTWAACLALATTGFSLYHWFLMVFWAIASTQPFMASEVEAAFRNWHILFGILFAVLHLFLYRVLKEVPPPAQPDQE